MTQLMNEWYERGKERTIYKKERDKYQMKEKDIKEANRTCCWYKESGREAETKANKLEGISQFMSAHSLPWNYYVFKYSDIQGW